MADKNDGGPAFPSQKEIPHPTGGSHRQDVPGMSLRDYFAGQALEGMLANPNFDTTPYQDAMAAYAYADAMLKERDQ